jgi:hypothetical protein
MLNKAEKICLEQNTLAYFAKALVTKKKSFYVESHLVVVERMTGEQPF